MSRARGNFIENLCCEQAEALGYCAFPARGSRGVVDIVCFAAERWDFDAEDGASSLVPLVIQCGTQGKAIRATLDDLHAAPRPIGSRCIVARYCKKPNGRRYWKFHTRAGEFAALKDALAKDAA